MGMRLLNLERSIKLYYKHQNKKTKVKVGLDITHMGIGASAQYAQEVVKRGSGYPRLQLSRSVSCLFKVWAVSLNARYICSDKIHNCCINISSENQVTVAMVQAPPFPRTSILRYK